VRVSIPQKNTFHPNRRALSHQAAAGKGFQALDVSAFVTQLGQTLEKHLAESKANDPQALRRRIAELEKQAKAQPAPSIERVEVPMLTPANYSQLAEIVSHARTTAAQLATSIAELRQQADRLEQLTAASRRAPLPTHKPAASLKPVTVPKEPLDSEQVIPSGARRMLQVLAQRHPLKLTRSQLGTLAGFTPSGGTFGNYFGALKRLSFIHEARNGDVEITQPGLDHVGADVPPAPSTTDEKVQMWSARLPAGAERMLRFLVETYPDAVSRHALGEQVSFTHTGGTFGNYLGLLRRNGLADVTGDSVRASPSLFLE
jgi:sulfur transfer protein SufE